MTEGEEAGFDSTAFGGAATGVGVGLGAFAFASTCEVVGAGFWTGELVCAGAGAAPLAPPGQKVITRST